MGNLCCKSITDPRSIFTKLLKMVIEKRKEDVAWDDFKAVFDRVVRLQTNNIAHQVLEQRDEYYGRNLFLWLCYVRGGPRKDIVEMILEINPELVHTTKDPYKNNYLHYCIEKNSPLDIVNYLLRRNPKVTTEVSDSNSTPLHLIRKETPLDVVKLIVEQNPKVTLMRDNIGESPIEIAVNKNLPDEIIKYLSKVTLEGAKPKFPHYPTPTHGGNATVKPIFWGMTLAQFNGFIEACEENHTLWGALRYRNLGKIKDTPFVSGYDLNDYFVKPFTEESGSCVALRINWDNPRRSQIMVSHPWGEDIKETQRSLNDCIEDQSTVIWFCIFANYQNEDGYGPTLTEQLKLEPFKQVISMPDSRGMVAIHSSKAELYDRKWCVHEIDEALNRNLSIIVGCSAEYLDAMRWDNLNFKVDTAKAKCSIKSDEDYIDSLVLQKDGGYDRLNQMIRKFREKLLETEDITVAIPANERAKLCITETKRPLVAEVWGNKESFKEKGVTVGTFVSKLTLEDGTEYTDMAGKDFIHHMYQHFTETRIIVFQKPKTKVKRRNDLYKKYIV